MTSPLPAELLRGVLEGPIRLAAAAPDVCPGARNWGVGAALKSSPSTPVHWIFVAARGLSLVVESRGYSLGPV